MNRRDRKKIKSKKHDFTFNDKLYSITEGEEQFMNDFNGIKKSYDFLGSVQRSYFDLEQALHNVSLNSSEATATALIKACDTIKDNHEEANKAYNNVTDIVKKYAYRDFNFQIKVDGHSIYALMELLLQKIDKFKPILVNIQTFVDEMQQSMIKINKVCEKIGDVEASLSESQMRECLNVVNNTNPLKQLKRINNTFCEHTNACVARLKLIHNTCAEVKDEIASLEHDKASFISTRKPKKYEEEKKITEKKESFTAVKEHSRPTLKKSNSSSNLFGKFGNMGKDKKYEEEKKTTVIENTGSSRFKKNDTSIIKIGNLKIKHERPGQGQSCSRENSVESFGSNFKSTSKHEDIKKFTKRAISSVNANKLSHLDQHEKQQANLKKSSKGFFVNK